MQQQIINNYLVNLLVIILIAFHSLVGQTDALVGCPYHYQYIENKSINWPSVTSKYSLTTANWLTLEQAKKYSNSLWIDIRTKLEQKTTPLEGVITLSIHELQDKQFLRNQPVLLINNGFEQVLLDKLVSQLRSQGLTEVFALYGGSYVLQQHKAPDQLSIQELAPEYFLMGSKSIVWNIVSLDLSEAEQAYLPEVTTHYKTIQTLVKGLNQVSAQSNQDNSFIKFVIVTRDEAIQMQLQTILNNKASNAHWVLLKGGLTAYQNYIKQQHKIQENAGLALIRPCGQ